MSRSLSPNSASPLWCLTHLNGQAIGVNRRGCVRVGSGDAVLGFVLENPQPTIEPPYNPTIDCP